MTADYSEALRVAIEAAKAAGQLLREEFHRSGGPRGADSHAEVDFAAEQLIRQRLTCAFQTWGYLGEETGRVPAGDGEPLWLVDPNSGTSAYLAGERGSAVSIALLVDRTPVLGVVYAFVSPDDGGDLFAWAQGCGPLRRQGRDAPPPTWSSRLTPRDVVLLSQGADRNPEAHFRCTAPARYRAVPSVAHRLALVACGEGAAMVSLDEPCSWDYAAGHALLRSVGGVLLDQDGEPVRYSQLGESQCGACFGGAPEVVPELTRRAWSQSLTREDPGDLSPPLPFPVRLSPGGALSSQGVLSRAQGCLLGQLAGDSLGGQVEFERADRIRLQHHGGLRLLQDGGTWGILAGQPTDDSEMALVLARSIVAAGGFDVDFAARAYLYWYRTHPFDIGETTRTSLRAASQGLGNPSALMKRSASVTSQSNGSLMRISPLAIYGYSLSPHQLADMASEDSSLTHPHPACRESCALFVVALARAIAVGESPEGLYGFALDWAERSCWDVTVLSALRGAADGPPTDYQTQQGWVLVALQNAFFQLLHAPNLEEGLVATVMAGGDTDTNAAIAGALLGAVHGRDAIPAQWRRTILSCRPLRHLTSTQRPRPVPFWPVDALELAECLAGLSGQTG